MSFLDEDAWFLTLVLGAFRAWWFDPFVASVSFGVFVNWYWYHERTKGLSSAATFVQDIGYGKCAESLGAYWIGVCLFKSIVSPPAPILPDGIPKNTSDVLHLLSEVVTGIVLYDFIMFFLHWAMHESPLLKSWHARHHDRHQDGKVEARDTLRHSLLDGSLQVLVNIYVQRFTPWGMVKTRLARALHNVIVTWMLTESHTASPEPYIWRRWFVGVREHRLHHKGYLTKGPYGTHHRHQQFFGYLDDARAWWSHSREQRRKLY